MPQSVGLRGLKSSADFGMRGGSAAAITLIEVDGKVQVRKSSSQSAKLRYQYEWLKSHQQHPQFPKVLCDGFENDSYFYQMEFCHGFEPLFDFIGRNPVKTSLSRLHDIIVFLEDKIYVDRKKVKSRQKLERYLSDKLIGKLQSASAMSPVIHQLLANPTISVNGREYQNPLLLSLKILESEDRLRELSSFEATDIHGDLTVANILVGDCGFVLLDPNGENWVNGRAVDYSKLWQSLHSGYEFLCSSESRRSLRISGNSLTFKNSVSKNYQDLFIGLRSILSKTLSRLELQSMLFHEAVHYSRLLPYQVKTDPDSAPIFLGVCTRLLNDYLEQYQRRETAIQPSADL